MAVIYTRGNHVFIVEEKAEVIGTSLEASSTDGYFKLTRIREMGWRAGQPEDKPIYIKASDITAFQ